MLTVNTLPLLDRQPVPVDVATTLVAVFVNPDQGLQAPAAGTANPRPIKLVPPLPKPPLDAIQ